MASDAVKRALRFVNVCRLNAQVRSVSSASHSVNIKPLNSLLIANRGEIAIRVGNTAKEHGVRTTVLYTEPDALSQHAHSSPFAVNLGAPSAYLNGDHIIDIAKREGCDSVHPGYGFLSENPAFARKCTEAGLTFVGPPWEAIEAMGDKRRSKEIMEAAGVPCVPGYHGKNQEPEFLLSKAEEIGYPVLLKAVRGGGGKGMRISRSRDDFLDQLASARSEAQNSFGDQEMLVEKYINVPRHIEVQVFADKHGNCVALGERDCSIQRRHQKIIEESPAPNLADEIRKDIWEKAKAAALAVKYEGAGTVEFIFDNESGDFYFMEMNTRLQVEHPVTEMVTGQDLVYWQLQIAEGRPLPLNQDEIAQEIAKHGWAIEARIYAENPDMNFIPDSGTIKHLNLPELSSDVRLDSGFVKGDEISTFYDPMIAKLIVRGDTRAAAIRKMHAALESYQLAGVTTNIKFIKSLCESADFINGDVETGYISKHQDDLFDTQEAPTAAWAQASLALLLKEAQNQRLNHVASSVVLGFSPSFQQRSFDLVQIFNSTSSEPRSMKVQVQQKTPDTFDIEIAGQSFANVRSHVGNEGTISSYFPEQRIDTDFIVNDDRVSVFQLGNHYEFKLVTPKWLEAALGKKDVANSVIAPMPCKILRVNVNQGDQVTKDQILVVIESMKMETSVRSPQDGMISKVAHKQGDICKAGTVLIEFSSNEDQ